MTVRRYNDQSGDSPDPDPVSTFLAWLSESYPLLSATVNEMLRKVEEEFNDLSALEGTVVVKLKRVSTPLWHFRLPKSETNRNKPVARVYFCYDKEDETCIWLLAGEVKIRGEVSDPEVIAKAELRCREIIE